MEMPVKSAQATQESAHENEEGVHGVMLDPDTIRELVAKLNEKKETR